MMPIISPYTGSLFFGGIDGLLYLDRKWRLPLSFIRICVTSVVAGGQQ